MKLYRIILPVSNIEEAVNFYRHVLGVEGQRVSPGRHYFDCEGTILACFDPMADGDEVEARCNPEHIYLSVANIHDVYSRVKEAEALYLEDSIKTRPWGEESFYAKDPFGNPLCFVNGHTVFIGVEGDERHV
ncbi:VOC family protein [Bacillus sp. SCS-153A]|uniref:VOC family protein n=1 Tax=Rossellomorea sedimentorum TaxID=3115294 RepID=UPI003906D207